MGGDVVGDASGRRRGRPPLLSRELIVDALRDADNVDTLTMRELATRLGVSHGALYRWVRSRDELYDLVSEVVIDRVLAADRPSAGWRVRLTGIGWAMHDEFATVPGYATHLARPHAHNAHSTERLRRAVTDALRAAGIDAALAEQSWYIFVTTIVGWLALQEQPMHVGTARPRFELMLDVLVRGLPARLPGRPRP